MERQEKIDVIKRLIISALVIVALLGGGYLILHAFGVTEFSREQIQHFIESSGPTAPLVFIFVSFIQVSFIPIPGGVTILIGNYLFGFWEGFLYSYIGMLLGSMISFLLGKVLGRRFVNWVAGGTEVADIWIKKLKGRENIVLFFMFLFPFFPDDMLCAIAGMFSLTWTGFIFMQLLTRMTSILGTLFLLSGEVIPYSGWGLVLLIAFGIICVITFLICMKYSEQINAKMNKFLQAIEKPFKRKKNNSNIKV